MSTIPFALPADPLLGGSLSTGLTGLPRPLPGIGSLGQSALSGLPYTQPITSLASQVPVGVGRAAAGDALNLMGTGGGSAAGRAGGLLSRLPGSSALSAASRSAAPWATMGTAAKFGRGLGAGILGEAGSRIIDATNIGGQNSNVEQGLQGAAQGAALGALVGAPFFGVGAGVGAAAGGAIGGALGILGNTLGLGGGGEDEDAPDPIEILGSGIQAAQLAPDQTEEILQTYEVLTALAEMQPEGELRDAAMAQAFDQSAAMILQAMQQKEQVASQAANTFALQAQAQDIFAPLAQDITDSSMLYANAMRGIRDDLPESYRGIADATVARELSSAQRLASAYQAQAAVTPVINRLTQYQQDYNNLAAQQFSQALAQQAAGGSAALGGSTSDVLAALTPQ